VIYFVTVNYHSALFIAKLVYSLTATTTDFNYKIVIINNSPDDKTIQNLASETVLIIETGCNLGFGNACNVGLKWIYQKDTSAIVWIINPDAYFVGNSYLKLNSFFSVYPDISILGTVIRTPCNQIWFGGGRFFSSTGTIKNVDLLTSSNADYVECDWVSGCSLIINLHNFSECPVFDSKYFLYYEDFDFCRRYSHEGYKVAVTKSLSVIHQPSSITNRYMRKKILYSTYSYLMTLERYTNLFILTLRLIKLLGFAIIFIFIQPDVGVGKIQGVYMYLRDRSQPDLSNMLN
jgi:N-acetylglucosaminyl-diphospho-decaprenol L-rhamnosyltransferase